MLKKKTLNLHTHKKVSSLLVHHYNKNIPIFQKITQLSQNKNLHYTKILHKKTLIFTLLSIFLKNKHFIPLLLNILQPNIQTQIYTIINNNITHK